jgi:Na+/melibiose symporter-like transporter
MNAFLELWERQAFLLMVWSILCFILGMTFCTTCYWYYMRRKMKRATKFVKSLANDSGDKDA